MNTARPDGVRGAESLVHRAQPPADALIRGAHVLDPRERIDAQHAHELRHRQQHPVARRQRAAGKAGARAARHHWNPHGRTGLENALHLLLGLGQRDDHRQLAVGGEAVAFVRPGVFFLVENGALRQELAQRRYDR